MGFTPSLPPPPGAPRRPPEGPRRGEAAAERGAAQADGAPGQREEADTALRHAAGAGEAPAQGERQAEGGEQPDAGGRHAEARLPDQVQGTGKKENISSRQTRATPHVHCWGSARKKRKKSQTDSKPF